MGKKLKPYNDLGKSCAPSNMASEFITVYVKSLSGELIELKVDPEKGLKGVQHALTLFDSKQFPRSLTRVFFLDDNKVITENMLLGVLIHTLDFYLNRTTGEFFASKSDERTAEHFAQLSTVLTVSQLHPQERGEARWKSTDHVVIVPKHLHHYVASNYNHIIF